MALLKELCYRSVPKSPIMTPTIAFFTIALLVLPQWLLMLLRPNAKWTQQLVDSDIIPFILLVIYVVCMTRYETTLDINRVSDIFQVFQIENVVLGAWAFIGFISLSIGGWAFNRVQSLTININWVMPSLFATFMITVTTILIIPNF